MSVRTLSLISVLALACVAGSGCRKKVATTAPPAAPTTVESPAEPAAAEPESEPAPAPAEPPASIPQPAPEMSFSEQLQRLLRDAHFDYDRFTLRTDALETLSHNGTQLRELFEKFSSESVVVEGHADERGSAEYNLGLADRRAVAAREFLTTIGVAADRLKVVSYGKERPQCSESSEDCWQRNRRVHATALQ